MLVLLLLLVVEAKAARGVRGRGSASRSTTPQTNTQHHQAAAAALFLPVLTSSSSTHRTLSKYYDPSSTWDGTYAPSDLAELCATDQPILTENTVSVKYEFRLYSEEAADDVFEALSLGNEINGRITEYLRQIYILDFCTGNSNHGRKLGAGDVRAVEPGETSLFENACDPNNDGFPCVQLQSSNTVHFAEEYTVVSQDALGAAILHDIATAFEIGVGAAVKDVEDADYFQGSLGTVSAQDSDTDSDTGSDTDSDGATGSGADVASASDNNDEAEASTTTDEAAASNTTRAVEQGGMSPVGKAFLSLFILALVGALCYVGYRLHRVKKEESGSRKLADRDDDDDDGNTSSITSQRGPLSPRQHNNRKRKGPKEWFEAILNQVFDSDRAARIGGDGDQRNIVIADTMDSASTNGGAAGTEVILDDLQKSEKLPASVERHQRFTPATLPPSEEIEADLSCIDEKDEDKNASSFKDENEWSYDEHNFSFNDIQILVDDSSSLADSSRISKRTYYVSDTVAL